MPKSDNGKQRPLWWDYFENEDKRLGFCYSSVKRPSHHMRADELIECFGKIVDAATHKAGSNIYNAVGYSWEKFYRATDDIQKRFPLLSERQAEAVYMNGLEKIVANLWERAPHSTWAEMAAMHQSDIENDGASLLEQNVHE
jgi:hypothetical protein